MGSGGVAITSDSEVKDGDVMMNSVEFADASEFRPDSASSNASVGVIGLKIVTTVIYRNLFKLSYR